MGIFRFELTYNETGEHYAEEFTVHEKDIRKAILDFPHEEDIDPTFIFYNCIQDREGVYGVQYINSAEEYLEYIVYQE